MTVDTAASYGTTMVVRYQQPTRKTASGVTGRRGGPMVATLAGFKVAIAGSAAAVTLAAGGITLGGVLAIFSSATGILVSIATLALMARKYLQGHRTLPPPPIAPVPPPGLPLGRVTKEEYARALAAQVHYSQELLRYSDQVERYYQKRHHEDGSS